VGKWCQLPPGSASWQVCTRTAGKAFVAGPSDGHAHHETQRHTVARTAASVTVTASHIRDPSLPETRQKLFFGRPAIG